MSSYKDENELMLKTANWVKRATIEINRAGGSMYVLDEIPENMLIIMVRNNIFLKFEQPK